MSYSLLLTMKYFDTESKTTLVLFCSNGSLWTLKETPNSQQIQPKAQERGRDKDMGRQMSSIIQWLGPLCTVCHDSTVIHDSYFSFE